MGRPRKGQEVQQFRNLTRRIRQGQQEIKPEFIPELVAWLVAQSQRYAEIYAKILAGEARRYTGKELEWMVYHRTGVEVIQELVDRLAQPVRRDAWNDAVMIAARAMGIEEGQPLPPQLDPTGYIGPLLPPREG